MGYNETETQQSTTNAMEKYHLHQAQCKLLGINEDSLARDGGLATEEE